MSLKIKDLRARYADHDFQWGPVDWSLAPNRTVALIGPNGAGKSTLFRILMGQLDPRAGSATWRDLDLLNCGPSTRARKLAWLSQSPGVAFNYTAEDVVRMGTYPHRTDRAIRPEEALEMVGMEQRADRAIHSLSGGEQRRVFLARVLAQSPEVLLLDEPTAQLDLKFTWSLPSILDRARERLGELTVIWAQHDLEQASRVADTFVLFGEGQIVAAGESGSVLTESTLSTVYDVDLNVSRSPSGKGVTIEPA